VDRCRPPAPRRHHRRRRQRTALRLPTSAVDYRVGNTVEGRDTRGVERVLSEKPIRVLDLPGIDDEVIDASAVHPTRAA